MEARALRPTPSTHRPDEFPTSYSLAVSTSARLRFAAGHRYSLLSSCRSRIIHRTANCILTVLCQPKGASAVQTYALASQSSSF